MAETEKQKTLPQKKDEDPVGKVYDSRLMKRLGHYLRPYWLEATVSSLAVSLKSLSDVTGPYLVKVGIDRYLTGTPGPATNWLTRRLPADPYHGITVLATIYLGALICAYFFEFVQTYLMQWMGQKIMFDLRRDIFRHMQRMHIGFFDTHAVGRLVTRLTSDVDAINEMFTAGVLAIVDDFFNLTIMAGVMLTINWKLALIAFAVLPLILLRACSATACARAIAACAPPLRASTALRRNISAVCLWCSCSIANSAPIRTLKTSTGCT
jgi:ATP-binding cassette subfamily B multidrug efflux pump